MEGGLVLLLFAFSVAGEFAVADYFIASAMKLELHGVLTVNVLAGTLLRQLFPVIKGKPQLAVIRPGNF